MTSQRDNFIKACKNGYSSKVQSFLDRGFHPNFTTENNPCTPLYYACVSGRVYIVQILLKAGADPNQMCHGQKNPLIKLSESRNNPIYMNIITLLLKNGANPNLLNSSALVNAVINNNTKLIIQLLNAGANPFIKFPNNEKIYDLTNDKKTKKLLNQYMDFYIMHKSGIYKELNPDVIRHTIKMLNGFGSPRLLTRTISNVSKRQLTRDSKKLIHDLSLVLKDLGVGVVDDYTKNTIKSEIKKY
jgi:hypothetical protein